MLGLSGTFWRRTNEGFPGGPHGPQNCNKKNCALTWKELEISLPSHQQSHDSPFCAACETAIARAAKLYIHVIYPSYFQTTHRPYKFPISSFAFIKAAFRRFCTIDIFHGDVMTRQQQILAAHWEYTIPSSPSSSPSSPAEGRTYLCRISRVHNSCARAS